MGDSLYDDEGRVTIAKFGKIAVISAYFPNSQDAGARLDYKLGFCAAILKKCDELVSQGFDIVLNGDYNIAHKPIDLANPKANEHNAGYLPEERAWMDTFTQAGYTDTFRHFCAEPQQYTCWMDAFTDAGYVDVFRHFSNEPNQYTWWSYRFHAREKNIGWRIDYQCVNPAFLSKVKSCRILSDVTGSDHCPIEIIIES